jgi:hypothetical protein
MSKKHQLSNLFKNKGIDMIKILTVICMLALSGCTLTPDSTTINTDKLNLSIQERMSYRRAIEAVVWGMPAANYDIMLQEARAFGLTSNQIVFWSRPSNWKNQLLTPNPNTIYLLPFIDTSKVGPMVLEIPPAKGGIILGAIDDVWQVPLVDVGPAGKDEGKGGKYLILPPKFKGKIPKGYIVIKSSSFQTYALLRSIYTNSSDAEIAKAVKYAKRIKLYPLSQAGKVETTKFIDAFGKEFDANIPYDFRFFESLNRVVQAEDWLTRDKAMIDTLKSIGIEKGKPFNVDARQKKILNMAISEAHIWMDAQYDAGFSNVFNKGNHWALPVFPDMYPQARVGYTDINTYPVDARAVTYTFVFYAPKDLGKQSFYFYALSDSNGKDLEGRNTYRLHVPANVPVKQFWSMVLYDRETHGLIRNMASSSLASNMPQLKKNKDGSVDIWFGPKAPAGKESNWIPTNPNDRFDTLFRFYGPKQELFNKTWILPDIELVK